jgi:hypothetical protein
VDGRAGDHHVSLWVKAVFCSLLPEIEEDWRESSGQLALIRPSRTAENTCSADVLLNPWS